MVFSHFIDEEAEGLRCLVSPGKVAQPMDSGPETDFCSFDLKALILLLPSFSFITHPMSPSMFFHHKTQLGWCFLISIWTEGECSLLAAWCISMNYWTLEPSHKSSASEETQMADSIQSSVGLSGQWLQIQHQPTPCIVGNSFHHPHLDSVSTGAGGRGSGG